MACYCADNIYITFIGLQIPSQLVAERVGLNRWIGFLMCGWGVVASCMAGLTSRPAHLYVLRFLLGDTSDWLLTLPNQSAGEAL